jgi:hypothetical protein
MSQVTKNLHKVLGYMAESPEFNESTSALFVFEAIQEIEDLEADAKRFKHLSRYVSCSMDMSGNHKFNLCRTFRGSSFNDAIDQKMKDTHEHD